MAPFVRESTGPEVVEAFADQVKGKTSKSTPQVTLYSILTATVVITGPSAASLGAETAKALAKASPAEIILVGRSESKINPVIKEIAEINPEIKARFVQCDLSNNDSVRKAAEEITTSVSKIDILNNSAGVMAIADYQKSVSGIEMQFAANHIGHFLLTNLLVSKMGKGSRIVTLTSTGFALSDVRDDYNFSVRISIAIPTQLLVVKTNKRSSAGGQRIQPLERLRPSQIRKRPLHPLPRHQARKQRHRSLRRPPGLRSSQRNPNRRHARNLR